MNFFNNIKNTIPHIYCIGHDYYYLGIMICRKCTDSEIKIYKQLMVEYNYLSSVSYSLEPTDCKDLKQYYDKMIAVDEPYDEIKHNKTKTDIEKLLSVLSNESLHELNKQYETYKQIMRWYAGMMY